MNVTLITYLCDRLDLKKYLWFCFYAWSVCRLTRQSLSILIANETIRRYLGDSYIREVHIFSGDRITKLSPYKPRNRHFNSLLLGEELRSNLLSLPRAPNALRTALLLLDAKNDLFYYVQMSARFIYRVVCRYFYEKMFWTVTNKNR